MRTVQRNAGILVLSLVMLTVNFACADGTEFMVQDEKRMRLPFYPTSLISFGNGDFTVVKNSSVITWSFNDSAVPLADAFGHGSEMLVDGTGLSVVNDETRGNVLSFDGTAHLKGPGTDASLDGLPAGGVNLPFTVAFWLKPDAGCGATAGLVYWGQADARKQMLLRFNKGAKKLIFSVYGNSEAMYPSAGTIFDGAWHHVALSYDGNRTFTAYYDGAPEATLTIGADYVPPNKGLTIGNASNNVRYKGMMDDFVLVNYAMTEEDVAALADVGVPSAAVVPDVTVNGTGSLSQTNGAEMAFRTLSGNGVLGGLECAGATVVVGQGGAAMTNCSYAAMIRGDAAAPLSLVKRGATYGQILSGSAVNVTNISVEAGTLSLRRPVARQGLVCLYQFDDASDLGFDASPAGFRLWERGEGEGLSTVSDGVSGRALHFPNTNYLLSAASTVPSRFPFGDDPYTVSVWIRPTTAACSGNAPIFCWGATRTRRLIYVRLNGTNKFRFSNYSEDLNVTVGSALDDGNWHHIAAVYDNTTHTKSFYVDGALAGSVGSLEAMDVYGGDQLHIGHGTVVDTVYTGDMDEFMVLDYAWSDAEASAEYARKPAANVAAESLLPQPVAHYSFDNAENLGADTSGNGLDLSSVGTVEAANDDLACGGAVQLSGSQYLTLATYSELLPKTNNPFTVICRYKPDTVQSANTSVISLGGSATSANISSGNIVKLGPGTGKTLAARYVAGATYEVLTGTGRSDGGTDRQRWTTAAIVYSPRTGKRDNVVKCYLDGVEVSDARNMAMNIVDERFDIGSDLAKAGGRSGLFSGLIDDVQVFNCALSAGEIDLIARRLSAGAGKSAPETPAVLGSVASVSVADNAVLNVRSAETVSSIAGAGDVEISSLASLSVGRIAGFSGQVTGLGVLRLSDDAAIEFGDGSSPVIRSEGTVALGANVCIRSMPSLSPGNYALVEAGAFSGTENLSTWRLTGGREAWFRISADGKRLSIKIPQGFTISIK